MKNGCLGHLRGKGVLGMPQGMSKFFFIWPPGAEQLGAEGENMGVLAFFEGFKGYNGP